MNIRKTLVRDIADMQRVADATELFPSSLLPEMIQPYLDDPSGDGLWLSCDVAGSVTGLCFAEAEPHTDRTWNMRALGVLPEVQRTGQGRMLVAALEDALRVRGQRLLIIDTSGLGDFVAARAFYTAQGYDREARIRDYWSEGDDKITFRKRL